jgi:hypothetical protein
MAYDRVKSMQYASQVFFAAGCILASRQYTHDSSTSHDMHPYPLAALLLTT